jgi:glucose/arabinose dehydrogenase
MRVRSTFLTVLASGLLAGSAGATTLPTGFVQEQIVGFPFGASPVAFDFIPDGRYILAEQWSGTMRIAEAGSAMSDSIFNVADVLSGHPERGLLGLTLDPDWPTLPYVYVYFTAVDSTSKVVRYEASGALSDPNSTAITLGNRYEIIDDVEDRFPAHNAGTLRFDPDGMLLVSIGDDGRACTAQDLTSPYGKILRMDVSSLPPVAPPSISDLDPGDNPFPGTTGYEPLALCWGLRNPFRFCIDAPTGDIFIGNVGWDSYEEIERIPGPPRPQLNFGWPQFEGPLYLDGFYGNCGLLNPLAPPIHAIPHPINPIAVTGGVVIRPVPASPTSFPASMDGNYLFAEVYSGELTMLRDNGGTWEVVDDLPGQPAGGRFGTDFHGITDFRLGADGAVYMNCLGLGGDLLPRGIHRVRVDPTLVGAPDTRPARPALRAEPNPVRPEESVVLRYRSDVSGEAQIAVFDVQGRRVASFSDHHQGAGERTIFLGSRQLGSAGVRFVTVTTADGVTEKTKVTRLR